MRLIDADKVKELINGLESLPWEEEVDDLVDSIPTAYDVEKVVTELEQWSFETEIVIPQSDGYDDTATRKIICTKNALDIVRNGGKE